MTTFIPRSRSFLVASLLFLGLTASSPAFAEKPKKGAPADAPKLEIKPTYTVVGAITIDSDPGDWGGFAEVEFKTLTAGEYEYDWSGPKDLSVTMRTGYDANAFYVYVKVRDNAVTAGKKKGGDRIELWFDLYPTVKEKERYRRLVIDVSPLAEGLPATVEYKEPKKLSADALSLGGFKLDDGYDVELAIPFSELGSAPLDPIGFCAMVYDWDLDDPNEDEAATASCPFDPKKKKAEDLSTLDFGARDRIWDAVKAKYPDFDKAEKLTARGDLAGDARDEDVAVALGRLFVAGMGLDAGSWFAYDLALEKNDKVVSLTVQETNADDSDDMIVVTRHRCRAGDVEVERDLMRIFTFTYGAISDPILTMVVAQRSLDGSAVLTNKIAFGKKGIDVSVDEATGWTAESFVPCPLVSTTDWQILSPWGEVKKRKISLNDGTFEVDEQ